MLPRHFYSEIPDIRGLRNTTAWRQPYSMLGIQGADLSEQRGFVEQCCSEQLVAVQQSRDVFAEAVALSDELGYGPTDAEFLFCFICSHCPRRILQVGCGVSTAVIQLASAYVGYEPEIICVEPYPSRYLTTLHERRRIRLVEKKAETLDMTVLTNLAEGDMLFVDSTHAVRPGGEVPRIILEVLPRLSSGTWVHFHDIWFPYDYSPGILTDDLFFWHESILLHAFLVGNLRFRLRVALSMLARADAEQLKSLLPRLPVHTHLQGEVPADERYPVAAYLQAQ